MASFSWISQKLFFIYPCYKRGLKEEIMLAYHDASAGIGAIHRNDELNYDDNDYKKARRQVELNELHISKARRCLKKTTKFLFSHIGLVGLVVIYAVAGGFVIDGF